MKQALDVLASGGLVVFPTETVWGLGARLDRPDAIEAIFALKGRDRRRPLQVMVSTPGAIELVARPDDRARRFAERLLPGPLSLVLPAAPDLPDLGAATPTVAVRVPDHPTARELLERSGPLATTSANLSGHPTPHALSGIRDIFGDRVAAYVDGPPQPGGVASTLLDLTGDEPTVLRAGAVGREALEEALGGSVRDGC